MQNPLQPSSKKNIRNFRVWYEQAQYDLRAARVSEHHNFFEWACYQAVQSVEKALKSVIVHAGYKPPKTHKLSVLIGMSNNVNEEFRQFKFKFRRLEVLTIIARYPFAIPHEKQAPHNLIKESEAIDCINEAENILNKIREIHGKEVTFSYSDVEGFEKIDVDKRLENVKNIIVSELNPTKIILFGPYARGDKDKLSTLDLIIIADLKEAFVDRVNRVRELTKGAIPVVSPLVYTPSEFETLVAQEGESYLESAIIEGKVIYERG